MKYYVYSVHPYQHVLKMTFFERLRFLFKKQINIRLIRED